jgi:hypothetical protein
MSLPNPTRAFRLGLAEKKAASPFLILPLDVPPAPLFNEETNLIPQVPLYEIFNKFDGATEKVRAVTPPPQSPIWSLPLSW